MAVRIIAMVFIFVSVTIAWVILGTTVAIRTENQDMKLKDSVGQLWGTVQKQRAPWFFYQTVKEYRTKKIQDDQIILLNAPPTEISSILDPDRDITPVKSEELRGRSHCVGVDVHDVDIKAVAPEVARRGVLPIERSGASIHL